MLEAPFKGKVRGLSIKRTTDAIMSSQIWSAANRTAFERINERRRLRNLIAHFTAKRFVKEDAFIFMTKSAADFEQVYDRKPDPNHMLYGISLPRDRRESHAKARISAYLVTIQPTRSS